MKIINNHYKNEELHINNENAPVVMNYMDQTIRAIRETIVEMVDYKNILIIRQDYLVYMLLKAMKML